MYDLRSKGKLKIWLLHKNNVIDTKTGNLNGNSQINLTVLGISDISELDVTIAWFTVLFLIFSLSWRIENVVLEQVVRFFLTTRFFLVLVPFAVSSSQC